MRCYFTSVTETVTHISNKVLSVVLEYQDKNPGLFGWKANREGMCAIASLLLMNELNKYGLNPCFVTSMNHCFLMLENNILDITATQFGGINQDIIFEDYCEFLNRVMDNNIKNAQRSEPWEIISRFGSVEDVLTRLKFNENQFNIKQWKNLTALLH